MFHIDFESKRFRTAVRYFTYGVMTTSTLVLTAIIIFLALGYRFDRENFSVIRQGLVQLSSHPEDMDYYLNDKFKGQTPARLGLEADSYNLKLSKSGYRDWQKQITVEEGQVHRLDYPRLIPNELNPENIKSFKPLSFAKIDPSKRWLITYSAKNQNVIELIDIKSSELTTKKITIPKDELTLKDGKVGNLNFVQWSHNSETFIVKHKNGDIVEHIYIPRERPEDSINLNMRFDLSMDDVHFSGSDPNIIFALTNDVLRRFTISDNLVSGVLLNGVKDFEVYNDTTIVFSREVKQNGNGNTNVGIQRIGLLKDSKEIVLEELPVSNEVKVAYREFDGHSYFVVANRTQKDAHIYQDPETERGKTYFESFTGIAPSYLKFSPGGRFIMLQQGSKFAVYDFYEEDKFSYNIEGEVKNYVKWIDGFHLAVSIDNKLNLWDFDGNNQQELVSSDARFEAIIDESEDIIYTFPYKEGSNPIDLSQTSIVL